MSINGDDLKDIINGDLNATNSRNVSNGSLRLAVFWIQNDRLLFASGSGEGEQDDETSLQESYSGVISLRFPDLDPESLPEDLFWYFTLQHPDVSCCLKM